MIEQEDYNDCKVRWGYRDKAHMHKDVMRNTTILLMARLSPTIFIMNSTEYTKQ